MPWCRLYRYIYPYCPHIRLVVPSRRPFYPNRFSLIVHLLFVLTATSFVNLSWHFSLFLFTVVDVGSDETTTSYAVDSPHVIQSDSFFFNWYYFSNDRFKEMTSFFVESIACEFSHQLTYYGKSLRILSRCALARLHPRLKSGVLNGLY